MLKKRLITAGILIPIVVGIVFALPSIYFMLFSAAFLMLAAWEWTELAALKTTVQKIVFLLSLVCATAIATCLPIELLMWLAFSGWLLFLYRVVEFQNVNIIPQKQQTEETKSKGIDIWWNNSWMISLMGILVLTPCWIGLTNLHQQSNGKNLLLFLFLLVWGVDSVAYFVGRKFGKTKLASNVSPGKTWEGFYGALVITTFLAILGGIFFEVSGMQWPFWLVCCLLTFSASVLGDLFESMLKRVRGIKDSGTLFPGHGGVLDRIDSMTAATPVFIAIGTFFGLV